VPLLRDTPEVASAYLRAHVSNPVDWWAWGDDAFDEARRRDVPVFLSVGYAACHWCHVMAHESFEDPRIGEILRADFVAIKVDREERPDVDQVYMAATQLISGHGGWPMSVFLTPDGRPFTAGTYYPPVDRGGQVGFGRLLSVIATAWRERRDDVETQARALEQSLAREVGFIDHLAPLEEGLDGEALRHSLARQIAEQTDNAGGQGAPRFPRPSYVRALWAGGEYAAASRTLRAMAFGGLYDHIEGGFARYSVDAQWHVPHFEQMLSDQALLARCYFEAARVLDDPTWRDVARATVERVLDAFAVPLGFASSLDADAGGHEGSHVTWSAPEVSSALEHAGLGAHVNQVLHRWRITSPGLFEGRSIPRLADGEPFTTPDELRAARQALRDQRATRPQPGRDEKVVLEWNAMFASALLLSGDAAYEDRALQLLRSLATSHYGSGRWWRTEQRNAHATTSDLAWLLDACVDAFEVRGSDEWLDRANDLAAYLTAHYWDGELPSALHPERGAGFYAVSSEVTDLYLRPKEIFDGATPSCHAQSTRAFARLGLITGNNDALAVAQRLVDLGAGLVGTHPQAVVDLADAAGFVLDGVEIVVPGPDNELTRWLRGRPGSRRVLVTGENSSPLLRGRQAGLAYLCRGGVCHSPVATIRELEQALSEVH